LCQADAHLKPIGAQLEAFANRWRIGQRTLALLRGLRDSRDANETSDEQRDSLFHRMRFLRHGIVSLAGRLVLEGRRQVEPNRPEHHDVVGERKLAVLLGIGRALIGRAVETLELVVEDVVSDSDAEREPVG